MNQALELDFLVQKIERTISQPEIEIDSYSIGSEYIKMISFYPDNEPSRQLIVGWTNSKGDWEEKAFSGEKMEEAAKYYQEL